MSIKQEQQLNEGEAIPFITIDDKEGEFQVTQEAMVFLETLPKNMKISIIAIAGPYRTGKSFLANRILNQNKGFHIGSTTQACTKGIWIWNNPVQISNDTLMLLLDTEGLASTERSTNIDIKIFSLSILLAQIFLYNQMGPITENSLEDISLVANLTKYIHIHQGKSETGLEFRQYFPSFLWVLRDFYHDLEGQTPKQYLEECLTPAQGLSKAILGKNQIRESIVKYFKDRDCFTLIRPVNDESKLAHIDDLKYEELKLDFRKQVNQLMTAIKKRMRPKVVNGKVLNGSMFLSLSLEYVEAINSKETPTILTAIDRVVQGEAMKIQDENYEKFSQEIESQLSEDNMPFTKDEINKVIKKLIKKYQRQLQIDLARVLTFQEIIEQTTKFKTRIQDIIQRKQQENYSISYHFSKAIINKLFESVENPFTSFQQQFDSIFIHDYIKKWINIIKDYKENGKSMIQYEIFAESISKLPETTYFVNKELIEFEHQGEMEDNDEMSTQVSSQQNINDLYAFQILEKVIDQIVEIMNEQVNKLKITLKEAQENEKKLSQQKKSNDQLIELQRQQNEEIHQIKNDFDLKIENLKREILSRKQELDSLKQVKQLEISNIKKNQERQLRDKDEDIKHLEQQKTQCQQMYNMTQAKVEELDSEKRKEISSIQNEIKKLEEDIEGLKTKMKNKENNPHFQQVNNFFGEVKNYIDQYNTIFNEVENSKTQKMKAFELQKQLNDLDYHSSQNELKLKKELDEELRKRKDLLDNNKMGYMNELDQFKAKIYTLEEKKAVYEQQLEQIMTQIADGKDRQMNIEDSKKQLLRQCEIKDRKINEMKEDIQTIQKLQSDIEEKIYKLSIENKSRQDDKDIMLMLLPSIYRVLQGKPHKLKEFLNQIENDQIKSKLRLMFQNYKISLK